MKNFINFLPPWVETNIQPAFYDKESGSVLQQTARMYAKVNQLVRHFNNLYKETKETVADYIAKFVELKDFVDTYFENLDVQEEINNKLDAMAEDGTLQALLQDYFPLGDVSFNKLSYIKTSKSDLYGGYDHSSLQGFCLLPNGNAVIALRSTQAYDNYVKLCEVNYKTGTVLRYVYVELQHANSLSYRSDNHTIYVAACNTASGGSITPDDRIFVVDYTDFSIIDTINVGNIPAGHRIRSVWYDNDTNTLYGGDIHEMYIIDETTETITETITLDTTYIDTTATNQTLKKVGNYYFGLYISFLAIWDMTGNLVRLINIDTIQQNDYVGEPEDFAFDEDDNIVLGSTVSESPRLDYTYTNFYVSNLSKGGKESISNYWGAGTSPCPVYVDINSAETEELGTAEKPFKDLQIAINYAKNLPKFAKIYLASGTYDYSYITGVAYMELQPNDSATVVINGIEVVGSRVRFLNSTADLTINGIYTVDSDFRIDSQNSLNIYKNALTSSIGYGFCVRSEGGTVSLIEARIEGEDDKNLTYINNNSIASFNTCSFYGYDGYYAIRANNNSVVYTFDNTYDETLSDTQHNISVENGAKLYHRNGMYSKQNFNITSQGMVYPTAVQSSLGSPVYYGDLVTVDDHFNHIGFTVCFAENNNATNEQVFELANLNNAVINTCYIGNNGLRVAHIRLSYDSDTKALSIIENKNFYITNDGTCTSSSTTATPAAGDKYKFACIKKITYMNI